MSRSVPSCNGYQVPPSSANSAVMPPIAGPIESTLMRWPTKIPIGTNGIRPTRISAVISTQRPADRRTPSAVPATHSTRSVISAST
jgi:hypothetical protein